MFASNFWVSSSGCEVMILLWLCFVSSWWVCSSFACHDIPSQSVLLDTECIGNVFCWMQNVCLMQNTYEIGTLAVAFPVFVTYFFVCHNLHEDWLIIMHISKIMWIPFSSRLPNRLFKISVFNISYKSILCGEPRHLCFSFAWLLVFKSLLL